MVSSRVSKYLIPIYRPTVRCGDGKAFKIVDG